MSVDQIAWEAAVRHLFEDAFPYDATGPRRHEGAHLGHRYPPRRIPDLAAGTDETRLPGSVRSVPTTHTCLDPDGDGIGCDTNRASPYKAWPVDRQRTEPS
jgi:hypothetical protein